MLFIIGILIGLVGLISWLYVKIFGGLCLLASASAGDINYYLCQLGSNFGLILPVASFFGTWGMFKRVELGIAAAIITALIFNFVIKV